MVVTETLETTTRNAVVVKETAGEEEQGACQSMNFLVVPQNVEAQYEKFVPQKFVYSYQRGDCETERGMEINHRKINNKIKIK